MPGSLPQLGSNDQGGWGYVEGEYRIATAAPFAGTTTSAVSLPIPGSFRDATLAVDARLEGDTDGRAIALTCRDQVSVGFYGLYVTPSRQTVALGRVDYGGQSQTLATTRSDAVRPDGESNHIELTCAGTILTASVNGTMALQAEDSVLREGRIFVGVAGAVPADARFDNLVVTQR